MQPREDHLPTINIITYCEGKKITALNRINNRSIQATKQLFHAATLVSALSHKYTCINLILLNATVFL